MKHELPETVRVSRVAAEAEGIKSLFLPCSEKIHPGQFVMIWLPGVDSKPVAVSYQEPGLIGVTVCAVGPWSTKVCSLQPGDLVGVLGPYGNSFQLKGRRVVLVGGGYGAATLMLLAEAALAAGISTTMIIGAKTEKLLLYRERVRALGLPTVFTTDDGSFGERGFTTDVLQRLLREERFDAIYACGPELMEKGVAEISREMRVPAEISLERHMKCGFGVCGACVLDDSGKRVCVEGTVFSAEELLGTAEFGRYHRDGTAAKHCF